MGYVSFLYICFFSMTVITHLLFGMIQVARHDTAALPTWCFVKFFDTLWRGRVWWIWHWRFQKFLEWGCLDGGLVGGIIRIFWSFVMTFSDRITTRVNVDGRTPQKGGRYSRSIPRCYDKPIYLGKYVEDRFDMVPLNPILKQNIDLWELVFTDVSFSW